MRKKYLLFFLLVSIYCTAQNFDSFASGIRINNTIYNLTGTDPVHQINSSPGSQFFNGANLGTFAAGSACGSITAAEVKTWKNASGNVCSVTLNWRVYEQSAVPGAFAAVPLTMVNDCNSVTNIFDDGFGPCAANDQKWKDYALSTSFLAGLTAGTYNLEIFFTLTGSDINNTDCEATHFISDFGSNFTASFNVSNPVANPSASIPSVCEGGSFTLNANVSGGTAPYTYAWSGPNGFASTDQNPTIPTVALTHAGTYFLVATDACGTASASGSTDITVTPGTIPTFDAILPAICRNGFAPILVNQSTNGITGAWSPSVVSNTATGNYIFTPDPNQCAVSFSQTIFVVNNVVPAFNLPATICYGSPAPALPAVSANGIFGSWNPTVISNTADGTYTFTPAPGQCATETTRSITITAVLPTFGGVPPICEDGAVPALPGTSVNGITGSWSPAVISNTTSATYTFTPNPGQCAPQATMNVTIIPNLVPEFSAIPPFCQGTAAPTLPGTSNNGVSGNWSPATVSNTASATYTFTPTLCGPSVTVDIEVIPMVIPTFDPIAPICAGATAPVLAPTSNNGISGTWTPATVSNLVSGSYTFTPAANDDCIMPVSISVTVNPVVAAVFPAIPTICAGEPAPSLPTVSDNGIAGTWSPTVINNIISGDYVFTPLTGECSSPLTVSVTIAPNITPLFPAVQPICVGAPAPVLPLISDNGISGTWTPSLVSNLNTATYTFTPDGNVCATEAAITVTVEPIEAPIFSFPTTICSGSTAPLLPGVSDNGVSGTWSPAVVSNLTTDTYVYTALAGECSIPAAILFTVLPTVTPTFAAIPPLCSGDPAPVLPALSNEGVAGSWTPATVSNTASGTYTFTPDPGICALPASLSVTVDSIVIPQFTAIPPICEGAAVPPLPPVSLNGITGSWNPAIVSNTASGNYTFTPDAGQCAEIITITIIVNPQITPAFSFASTLCIGAIAPILPTISDNGITGLWSPASISNLASASYTFTPETGVCANAVTLQIDVLPLELPVFAAIAPICEGSTAMVLPTVSANGITGSWLPATVDNTMSGIYVFTPATGSCALPSTLSVTVVPNQVPLFDAIPPICASTMAPVLPPVSTNGISGSWSPATVDNTTTTSYLFTPDSPACAVPATLTVTVLPIITPAFSFPVQLCAGDSAPVLPSVSDNGITGTWTPASIDNSASATYTFTPGSGICAVPVTISIIINPIVLPLFDAIAPICEGSTAPVLPLVSNNGIIGSWSPSEVSNSVGGVYTFSPAAGQCSVTTTLSVTVDPNTIPTFDTIPPLCASALSPILPLISTNGIAGTWNPSAVDNTETTVYTFTPDVALCALPVSVTIAVEPNILPSFTFPVQFCAGDAMPALPLISDNGITGTWLPAVIDNNLSAAYTFTPSAGLCAVPVARVVMITPVLTPQFSPIASFCEGSSAPLLPATSLNGIAGTWNPTTVSNSFGGTYTFTPAAGICATTTTLNVTVTPITVPVFDAIPPICSGDSAPLLPAISTNGITGVWSPSVIDNTASGTYTFTPDADFCAPAVSLSVTVDPVITPDFNLPAQICAGETAPALLTVSPNGITGTWNPAVVDNTASGVYVFTPSAAVCAVPVSVSITVNPIITPEFTALPPICSGGLASALPSTSLNGISGTWSPDEIGTTSSAAYTFTPAAGQCAVPVTVGVMIVVPVPPEFSFPQSICAGDVAPVLPAMSDNLVPGTWNPPVVSNTGTGVYIFTPGPGVCALSVSITITVEPIITPVFTIPASVCFGDVPMALPIVSNNGISGTWTPAVINTATTTVYAFTPAAGVCATNLTITIVVNPIVTPAFDPIAPICQNSTAPLLPSSSANGISGTWSPAIVDNTATGIYTFTPDPGQCALPASITIVVTPNIQPLFNALTPICAGQVAPLLPAVSLNGIIGSWNPPIVSNTVSGNYTFTADAGICAPQVTLAMTVNIVITPQFNPIPSICTGTPAPLLQPVSNEGITGTWNPSIISNTTSATYTFTPTVGQCAAVTAVLVNVAPIVTPTFNINTFICEGSAQPALPIMSVNGISGSWTPPAIDNTTTTVYSFTPNAGECASAAVVSISVTPLVIPVFDPVASVCSGTAAPTLPGISNNGIAGIWNPPVVSNTSTAIYTFTPNGTQCGVPVDIEVIVIDSPNDLELITTHVMNGAAAGVITVASVGSGTPPFEYSINDGSYGADNVFSNLLPGEYTITVRDANGCEYSSTAQITSACKIPKGLSPNNDGDNDVLVVNGCSVSSLEIFNRYGTHLRSYKNYNNDWDGTSSNGEQLPDGTYFYVAQTTDGEKSGYIYLTR